MSMIDEQSLRQSMERVKGRISTISNPNLLMNPDFKLNQRGQNEYTSANYDGKYTLDGWELLPYRVTGQPNGVKIVNGLGITKTESDPVANISQPLPDELISFIANKTCTMSASVSTGEIISKTFVCDVLTDPYSELVYTNDRKTKIEFYHWSIYHNGRPCILIETTDSSIVVNWVKLELGSYATPFVPPDPTLIEVLKNTRDLIMDVELKNTESEPLWFNNSATTIAFPSGQNRNNLNYTIHSEIVKATGGDVGEIVVSEKQLNGFTISYTGTALEVVLKLYIRGGLWEC